MNNKPLVTIIIPLYCQEGKLKKAVGSVFAQTETDWELIIVDDASTDNGGSLSTRLTENDDRCRVIVHSHRSGLWEARKTGIRASSGEFILFLDPREWLESDCLASLLTVRENTDADLVQMRRKKWIGKVSGKSEKAPDVTPGYKFIGQEYLDVARNIGYKTLITPFCGDKLYRTSFLREAVRHDFDGRWGEVQILNIHYLRTARSIVFTDYTGVNVPWAVDHSNYKFSRLEDFKHIYMLKKLLGQDSGMLAEELRERLRYHVRQLLSALSWTPEAVKYFMRDELSDPIWQQVGETETLEEIVDKEKAVKRSTSFKNLILRFIG